MLNNLEKTRPLRLKKSPGSLSNEENRHDPGKNGEPRDLRLRRRKI